MLPSATIGGTVDLYEPVHGSAPDIAGQDLANPIRRDRLARRCCCATPRSLSREADRDRGCRARRARHGPAAGGPGAAGHATCVDLGARRRGDRGIERADRLPALVSRGLDQGSGIRDPGDQARLRAGRCSTSCGTRTSCASSTIEQSLLYIDLHLVHEVTSPQAFERPARSRAARCGGPISRSPRSITTCRRRRGTCRSPTDWRARRSMRCAATASSSASRSTTSTRGDQGIVHVIGPELGLTQPGMTIVCGDSHTTHAWRVRRAGFRHRHDGSRAGAGDAVPRAQRKPKAMRVVLDGTLAPGRDRQGRRAGGDRPPRHGRRHGPRHRVRRQSRARAVDGTAHDALQHEHRGRRATRG